MRFKWGCGRPTDWHTGTLCQWGPECLGAGRSGGELHVHDGSAHRGHPFVFREGSALPLHGARFHLVAVQRLVPVARATEGPLTVKVFHRKYDGWVCVLYFRGTCISDLRTISLRVG